MALDVDDLHRLYGPPAGRAGDNRLDSFINIVGDGEPRAEMVERRRTQP